MIKQIQHILKTMRLRQWPKNAFVLAALVFDRQLDELQPLLTTLLAVILFSLTSSLVYIINDLEDIDADRQHPQKKHRPLASGNLKKSTAIIVAAVLGIVSFPTAFFVDVKFGLVLIGYFLLMLAYSKWLKHMPLIDVMVIAAGFVLRVAAGVVLIETQRFSPWLFVATTFLALFIGLGKRWAEIFMLQSEAGTHRKVLDGYTLELLDQLLTIVLSSTLITYCLYTFSAPITPNNHSMMLTIPFVIYGLFRYLYLIRVNHVGGAPEEIVLTDRPMQTAIGLWGITVVVILYLF